MLSVVKELTEEQANQQYPVGDFRNDMIKEGDEDELIEEVKLDALSKHIIEQFEINKRDKVVIEQEMMESLSNMACKYDQQTLNEIAKIGGSKLFMPLTSQQVSGAVTWINSILENGWNIEPTPIPDLPETIKEKIKVSIENTLRSPEIPKNPQGIPMNPEGSPMSKQDVSKLKSDSTDKLLESLSEEALTRSEKMETLIRDQFVDSNWDDALKLAIEDLGVFHNCFIKTVYKPVKKMVTKNIDGKLTLEVVEELVECDERVSPLDYFPSPDQTTVNDGSPIERMKLSRKALFDSIGLPGYHTENIKKVLNDYDLTGLVEWETTVDSQRDSLEGHSDSSFKKGTMTALRFMGPVKASEIKEWLPDTDDDDSGEWSWIKDINEDDEDIEIDAILVGNVVIKAVPNLDPLGHRKYYTTSYRKTPGSFWGVSPAMLVKPHQRLVNATCRALSNNMGIASGPMSYVLIDRLPQGETLGAYYPWKQFQMTSDPNGANVPPISFFQPNDNSQSLMNVYQYYMNEAYAVSGVPRGALEGPTSRLGSGDHTASGVASEIENASKAIRMAVSNVERDIVVKRIEDQYRTNMIYSEDDSVKGDFQVIAKGASGAIAKAVDNQQAIELLNAIAGGPGMQIAGIEGVASILARIAKNNGMPELVPSKKELKEKQKAAANQKPKPSPEEVKLQIEKIRAETRIKDQQLEDKTAEEERKLRLQIAQMELQAKEMDFKVKMALAKASEEQQLKVTALQGMNANARAKEANQVKLLAEQMKAGNKNNEGSL